MLKRLKRTACTLLISAGIACAASAAGVSDKEIVVGTHLDLSGPVAAGMPQIRNGMQMRFDEANEAGGVNGRKFRLIIEDNGSQPQMAVRAMDKLIRKDEIFAVVSPFGSGANAAVIKRAVDDGVVYFAPWGASNIFRKVSGDSRLLFTTTPNFDSTTYTGVKWMMDNFGSKKIGYIYQEGPLGEGVGAGVKRAMATKNLSYAAEAGYKAGDIDFSSQVARMKAADCDLIVLATITRETIGVMAEVKKLGWTNVKVLASNPGRTSIVLALGKDVVEGLYGIGTWKLYSAENAPAQVKTWMAAYKKRFNIDADENALLSYSYADIFIKGVQGVGRDLTADKLVKYLQTNTFEGWSFYAPEVFKGNQLDPEYVEIDQVKGGLWVSLTKPLQ